MDENKDLTEETKKETNDNSKQKFETKKTNQNLTINIAIVKQFFKDIFSKPFSEMKKIVENHKSFFIIAIIILSIWIVTELISGIITVSNMYSLGSYYTLKGFMKNSLSSVFTIISSILRPVIIVALISGIIYLFMKEKKKNYLSIVISIIVTKLPVVIAGVISLLGSISSELLKITNAFSGFCNVLSTILLYFAIKAIYNEEDDDKVTIKFIITMAVYYGISLILSFFKLYI